ncbi:MAG: hypothetical protein JW844_03290 [Candidatus Omnitrophica bacterium]|nr:hypothetical protein [Candidatus Omnitrophota bacterium]
MINPHVITMIGGITIIFALGMTVRLVYLPLAKAIKGTVQIDISSTMDLRQNLSIKARLISQKVDYGFRDTEFAGDELILKEGQTYEMRCIFVGPDGRELTGSFPHWRPDGAAGIVHIDPPAGDNVNITALKEGYARIVVEEAGLKAIVECRVAQ